MPIDPPMAAQRQLLVVHDEEDGHLIYDLLLNCEDDEETVVSCFPRPIVRFPSAPPPLERCAAFAVSGGSILGPVPYDFWDHTLFHNSVMRVGGYGFFEQQADADDERDADGRVVPWWPIRRGFDVSRAFANYKDMPAMLPVGDDTTVVRMDTILFDGIYSFEMLRRLPNDDGSWHAVPLPKPPVGRLADNELAFISAYFAVGTRVWISVTSNKGTFSLDISESGGEWRVEGAWQLPFEGRALYVPEFDSVIGLAPDTRLLCAYDFKEAGAPPVLRHAWKETLFPPLQEEFVSSQHPALPRPRDVPSLAYLGEGKFCICRPMSTNLSVMAEYVTYEASSFLVVQLKRLPSGELQLATCGKGSYMWPPHSKKWLYIGFVQPAT